MFWLPKYCCIFLIFFLYSAPSTHYVISGPRQCCFGFAVQPARYGGRWKIIKASASTFIYEQYYIFLSFNTWWLYDHVRLIPVKCTRVRYWIKETHISGGPIEKAKKVLCLHRCWKFELHLSIGWAIVVRKKGWETNSMM